MPATHLCPDILPPPPSRTPNFAEETAAWVQSEFASLDLGDERRNERFRIIVGDLAANPQASTPNACGPWKKTKAAYRLMNNLNVTVDPILRAHHDGLASRLKGQKVILAVHDTSTLNYTHHPGKTGLGPISANLHLRGFFVHPTMAFTPDRVPLGLIDIQQWVRDMEEFGKAKDRFEKDIKEKESRKWPRSFEATEAMAQRHPEILFISVSDRESDIYEFFEEAQGCRTKLLVRASWNRGVVDEGHAHLWEFMEAQEVRGTLEVRVARRKGKKERTALVEVRFAQVTLKPPRKKRWKPSLTLWAVYVHEPSPPPGEEPLSWMLLTALPVESFEDAVRCVEYYAVRFTIELYFKVLKSGCRIESRQYEDADDLIERCLPTYALVAWRILYLTTIGRSLPDLPCTALFEEDEWQALYCYVNNTTELPAKPPSLREAMIMVARLGGFLARKSDGNPGVKTIWEGLQKLKVITGAWVAFGPGRSVSARAP